MHRSRISRISHPLELADISARHSLLSDHNLKSIKQTREHRLIPEKTIESKKKEDTQVFEVRELSKEKKKLGDNSVTGEGAAELVKSLAIPRVNQNVLSELSVRLRGDDRLMQYNEDQFQMELISELNGNIVHGEHRFSVERGHYIIRTRIVSQLMRVQVPVARIVGRLSYSTIASYMRDSVSIDVKAVAGAISAITAIDFRLAQNLATNMLYGLTVVDNTMLYTKGWTICFLAYLENRYAQAHPAHQTNWSGPDGNFRFSLWTADGTAEQFKNDVQTGRFVFTQTNVPVQHYPILTHIARAGLTLGPVADQPNLRIARIAWPAIPISVYGDQPWVQPDNWDITANESGGNDGEDANADAGSAVFDLRRPYLQRIAVPARVRAAETATNRRVRATGTRRPSNVRNRPRATTATKSRSTTVENSSDTEGNGDSTQPTPPTEDPQSTPITDGPQMVEYWWLASGELANLQF
ncbi:hypothetical protein GJ496_003091 [Pomphorhynchus laevis]|nr:hypothetical protein GJ496_003091 [Pomphorhynchus laevis]